MQTAANLLFIFSIFILFKILNLILRYLIQRKSINIKIVKFSTDDFFQTVKNNFEYALIHLFSKIYFPRLTVPISIVISNLIGFTLQFLFFLIFLCYYSFKGITILSIGWIVYTPLLVIQMAALGLGVGVIISSMTTKYRDLRFLTKFGVQLWMYATPIVYPLSVVPSHWKWLIAINPMAPIVETFRHAFLGSGNVDIQQLGGSIIITFSILMIGIILFSRIEKSVMDTV